MKDQTTNDKPEATASKLERLVKCPCCGGDGKETCRNPDHGLISALSFHDIGRIGCPCCGHDEKHKIRGGGDCDECGGSGELTETEARIFCKNMDYDYEDIYGI